MYDFNCIFVCFYTNYSNTVLDVQCKIRPQNQSQLGTTANLIEFNNPIRHLRNIVDNLKPSSLLSISVVCVVLIRPNHCSDRDN